MNPRDELLERNVARLLGRAYRPVVPSETFRRELLRRVTEASQVRAPGRAAFVQCAERELARGPFGRWSWTWGLPALAALLLAVFGVWRFVAPAEPTPQRESLAAILARGAVAMSDGDGWRALEPQDGLAHHRLVDAASFETPASAAVLLATESGDTLTLAASSAARVVPDAGLTATLERGALTAKRADAGPLWRFEFACDASRRRAAVELSVGGLWLAAPTTAPDVGCARVRLDLGARADLVVDAWRDPLAEGVERELCANALVATPSERTERTRVETEPEPPKGVAEPLADVSGEVVDAASGAPFDAFTVVLAPRLTLPRPREPRSVSFTAAAGRFAIPEVRPGDYAVWIGVPGYAYFASAVVALGDQPFHVRAELSRGATVSGRVLDRATGRPVEGASVISESDVPASLIELHLDEQEYGDWISIERSDASGRFVLEHLRSTTTRLRVAAPGFAPAWIACDGAAQEVEVSLTPGATLVGRVEGADGSPQAEHLLVAVPLDSSQYPLYWSEQLLTDERGEFRASDLPAIQCVVVHLGSRRDTANWSPVPAVRYVTLVAGEETRADFTAAARGSRLFGRLLDPEGRPVGNRTLTLVPAEQTSTGIEDPTRWRVTSVEADGRYDVRGVAAGTYELYVSARAPMEVLYQVEVTVEANRELEFDVHLGAGSLRGRAVAKDGGEPIANVVWVLMRVAEGRETFAARVIGDPDGAFEIPSLSDGEYRLLALPQDGVHALESRAGLVVAGGAAVAPLEFRLARGGRASVQVRTSAGTPVVGAEVFVADESGRSLSLTEMQRTDTQGRLELLGLPAGRFRVSARSGDVASQEVVFDLAAGDSPTIELELGP